MLQHYYPPERAQGAGLPRQGKETGRVDGDLETAGNSWAAPAAHQVSRGSLAPGPPHVKLYVDNTYVCRYS